MRWFLCPAHELCNNILKVIPQVIFGEGSLYAHLNPTLQGREAVSNRPSAQENNMSEETKSKS